MMFKLTSLDRTLKRDQPRHSRASRAAFMESRGESKRNCSEQANKLC
jgi:hypothetical protein